MTSNKILIAKTAWSDSFAGEPVVGSHGYLQTGKEGNERFNFLPSADGRFYGYIPPMGLANSPKPVEPDGWLVFFVAKRPQDRDGLRVVGWYEDASIYDDYYTREEIGLTVGTHDSNGEPYAVCLEAPDARLIPAPERNLKISAQHIKRQYAYLRGPQVKEESWREKLADYLVRYRRHYQKTESSKAWISPERRKEIENIAVNHVWRRLTEQGYHCEDRQADGVGYDIDAYDKNGQKIMVEVKGTSLLAEQFQLTRKEMQWIESGDTSYFVALVVDVYRHCRTGWWSTAELLRSFSFTPLSYAAARDVSVHG